MERTKEVRYDIYCKHCSFVGKSASDDPCNECLGTPSNENSHVPVNFQKERSLINYINEDPVVLGYTRDFAKSKNWKFGIPTDAELKKYFKIDDKDNDYYEIPRED